MSDPEGRFSPELLAMLVAEELQREQEASSSIPTDQPSSRKYPKFGRPALIAGEVLDALSTELALASGNGREANSIMQGSPLKRLALKGGSTVLADWAMNQLSKKGHDKAALIAAALLGGALSGVGINNLRIAKGKK